MEPVSSISDWTASRVAFSTRTEPKKLSSFLSDRSAVFNAGMNMVVVVVRRCGAESERKDDTKDDKPTFFGDSHTEFQDDSS